MENSRLILYLSLALVLFLLWERWQAWQSDQHARLTEPPASQTEIILGEGGV